MAQNTGYVHYKIIEEYYLDNNLATGREKPNVDTDPDYIAPTENRGMCPVVTFIEKREQTFFKNDCPSDATGSYVTYTRFYGSMYSQEAAINMKNNDYADFLIAGQAKANEIGTCVYPDNVFYRSVREQHPVQDNPRLITWGFKATITAAIMQPVAVSLLIKYWYLIDPETDQVGVKSVTGDFVIPAGQTESAIQYLINDATSSDYFIDRMSIEVTSQSIAEGSKVTRVGGPTLATTFYYIYYPGGVGVPIGGPISG